MARASRLPFALAAALGMTALLAASVGACGTDAVGVGACREIENARCAQASACGIDLTLPVHSDTPSSNVDACVRFYHEQCLHGLAAAKEPGAVAVKACVDTIKAGDCAVVKAPETAPACAWLVPPVDTSTDAAVTDTGADSGADAAD